MTHATIALICLLQLFFQACFALTSTSKSTSTSDTLRSNVDTNIMHSYASYWENLLLLEYQQNVEEIKQRRKTWSRARLEASGMSIFHAAAEPDSEVYGEKIVRVFKGSGDSFRKGMSWKDRLTRGDVLVMTHTPTASRTNAFERIRKDPVVTPRECLVIDVGDDWLTVGVGPAWPSGLWEARKDPGAFIVRLDRTAPRAPLKAQRSALDRLKRGKAGDAAKFMAHIFHSAQQKEKHKEFGSDLTAQLPSRFINSISPSVARVELREQIWSAIENAVEDIQFEPNQSQKDAIAWALQRRISLIRGPPGTGKTRVAALLISSALQLKDESPLAQKNSDNNIDAEATLDNNTMDEEVNQQTPSPRVLAVTHSNGAADVLLEALLQMGVPAVRLGRAASVSPSVQHRTVDAIAEKIPQVLKLRQIAGDAALDRQERTAAAFDLKSYISDVKEVITKTAPVIVTSCVGAYQLFADGSGDDDSKIMNFPLVVLDEAAQTTEPALLCALSAAKAQQLVLVGDTKQLPPTITAVDLRQSLGISPMARLEKSGVGELTLTQQYRMPPSLLKHPSEYFYNGEVICAKEKRVEEPSPKGFPWPTNMPLAFINVGDDSEVAHNFGGRTNPTEAEMVVGIVTKLLEAGDTAAENIAVISPYSKQVQLIRTELSNMRIKTQKSERIRVGTVDSFQGYETDVIIFSAVRSNELNELGFLRDSRRLCVAITRAKRGLILLGDQKVLRSCRHWAALIDSCVERQCLVDATEFVDKQEVRLLAEAQMNAENKTKGVDLPDTSADGENDEFYGLFS